MFDGKSPAHAGDIPGQFVVIREKTQLPIAAVEDPVSMGTRRNKCVRIAQINTLAVVYIFYAESFVIGVASGGERLKTNHIVVEIQVAVIGGKVAIDAVADVIALTENSDGFAY